MALRLHRTYLGCDCTGNDNGRSKDARLVQTIANPQHALHDLYDPSRYDIQTNPKFRALVEITRRQGVPAPIVVRVNGHYSKICPEQKVLQEYANRQKEEPIVETVVGNSRVMAALLVNAERAAAGVAKMLKIPFVYKPMDDRMARLVFSEENNIRQGNSILQNLLIYEDRILAGSSAEDLEMGFGLPAPEIKRLYEPLRAVERAVVVAFSEGKLSPAQVKKLAKYHRAAQQQQLDDCLAKRGDFAPVKRDGFRPPSLTKAHWDVVKEVLRFARSNQNMVLSACGRQVMEQLTDVAQKLGMEEGEVLE